MPATLLLRADEVIQWTVTPNHWLNRTGPGTRLLVSERRRGPPVSLVTLGPMSAESAADKFVAVVVGLMAGLIAGLGGYVLASPWDFGLAGLFVGFFVGEMAGHLVYRAMKKPA